MSILLVNADTTFLDVDDLRRRSGCGVTVFATIIDVLAIAGSDSIIVALWTSPSSSGHRAGVA
jgi:hypothetical protein